MKRRCLLHLDSGGLSAWSWQRGRLQASGQFPDEAGGHADFADFLAGRSGERFALLVDFPEETLRTIEIPRLGRRDRAALIARRLAQNFPDTPLCGAMPLGRDSAAPEHEKLLLLALPAHWRLAPWLARLTAAGIDLPRLQTASQIAGPLLARLAPRGATTALLVICHRHHFRITGLAAGHPRFSRLVVNSGASPAAAIIDEAGRLHRYLLEQRLHVHGQPLPVCVVAPEPLLAELANHWPSDGELTLQALALTTAAAQIGLSATAEAIDSRAIELQLLASSPPAAGIPLAANRRKLSAARLGRLLIGGGGAALAGALAFAGGQLSAAAQAWDEARILDVERARIETLWAATRRGPAASPIDAASLQRLGEIQVAISRLQQQPGPAYRRLSHILDQQPAIEIERIDWKILPPPGLTAEPPPAPGESTTVYGRVRGDLPLTRDMPAEFRQFILALRGDPTAELLIRQAPGAGSPAEFIVELKRSLHR